MSHRGVAWFGAVVAVLLTGAVPAGAAPPAQGYLVSAGHNGSTVVRLAAGQWTPAVLRPTKGPVIVELVDTHRDDFSYSVIAMPDGDVESVWFDGNGGGFGSSMSTAPPRWLSPPPYRFPAGRYRVTVVTSEPTKLSLQPTGTDAQPRHVVADDATSASIAQRTLVHPSATTAAWQSLPFTVPPGSHQWILFSKTRWSGSDRVDYDEACVATGAPRAAPCVVVPFLERTVNPTPTNGRWEQWYLAVYRPDATGPSRANFYAALSGTISRRTMLAVGLP